MLRPVPLCQPYDGRVLGTAIIKLGRLTDIGLQYVLIRDGGTRIAGLLGAAATQPADVGNTLWGMYIFAGLRHAYWALVTNQNDLPTGIAVVVVLFNNLFNCVNTAVAVWGLATRPLSPSSSML